MAVFLLKTEPTTYSFADLVREGRCVWSGVSSAPALLVLRTIVKGDRCYIYHTGGEKAIVGVARVVSTRAYEDAERPGTTGEGAPKFAVIDLVPEGPLACAVTLAAMRADARFAGFALLRQSRLSVVRVPGAIEKVIVQMAGTGAPAVARTGRQRG